MPGPLTADCLAAGVVGVCFDVFLADFLVDGDVFGHGVLVQSDPFDRDGFLLHYGAFFVKDDFVFFLADRGAVHRVADVGVGDGFAFEPDFFALDRDGLGDVLGGDVLTEPGPACRLLLSSDAQLFFGACHRVIGGGPGGVMPDRAGPFPRVGCAGPGSSVGVRGAAAEVVVGVKPLFLSRLEVAVFGYARRVLNLVFAVGNNDVVPSVRAPSRGTNDSDVPNRPVLTVTKVGWPVSSSA